MGKNALNDRNSRPNFTLREFRRKLEGNTIGPTVDSYFKIDRDKLIITEARLSGCCV